MPGSELGEKAIFNVARTIQSREAREEYLRQVCGDDTGLRNRVTELLHGFQQGESFLESPAEGVDATIQTLSECTGDSIGAYKLIEQIGEGGMGIVFMAEQKEPVRRTVALKIIKPGMDTKQVVARFEAERQALALMNHPNVAKVLDAGATDSGRPYFVMELVRGIPMTDFCDKQKLDTRQRLELFVSICQAVQHAHQKGIIHRDIKPTNILVELHDVKAVPKVIDFGVAKATTHNLTEHSLHTGFSQMIGTPLYMSPEQAELSGLDIDTRTDIYSLGVLLYELLSGTTPFDRETLRQASYDEMRRMIREDEPKKPSDRISTLAADSLWTISEQRDCDPRRLTQTVRGELDWIAMKALDKDRTRRYESASAMAADVQNYLNDEPVVACPPTATYRFGKFARRNKVQLFVASVMVVAMVLGIIGLFVSNQLITQQRNEANNQKEIAERQKQNAEKNFRKAREAVDEYLMKVSNIQLENVPELQPLRNELLHLALQYYQEFVAEHGDDPTLQRELASAHLHIGAIATDIGSKQEGYRSYEKYFEIQKRLVAGDPTNADYRNSLGFAYLLVGRYQAENYDLQKAVASVRQAVKVHSELVKDHPDDARYEEKLAMGYQLLGRVLGQAHANDDEVVAAYSVNLDKWKSLVEKYPDRHRYRSDLAWAYWSAGTKNGIRDPEALQTAIDLMEELVANHPEDSRYKDSICKLYGNQGVEQFRAENVEAAVVAIRRGMAIKQELLNRDPNSSRHQFDLRQFHKDLGNYQSSLGKHAEAAESSRTAVELLKKLIERNPEIPKYRIQLANSSLFLGRAYHETGALTEAVAAYRDAAIALEWLIAKYPNRFDDRLQDGSSQTYGRLVAGLLNLERHEEVEEFLLEKKFFVAPVRWLAGQEEEYRQFLSFVAW